MTKGHWVIDKDLVARAADLGHSADAWQAKPEVAAAVERAHQAVFAPQDDSVLPVAARRALAVRTAQQHEAGRLVDHHRSAEAPEASRVLPQPLLQFTDLISLSPALAQPGDISTLARAGIRPDELVVAGQVVAFTVFQARLIGGLRLIAGHEPGLPVRAQAGLAEGRSKRRADLAPNGRPSPQHYTTGLLGWEPWVAPVPGEQLTETQRESYAGKPDIPYFRLLARAPEILQARTAVDDAIFLTRAGLPRAERELAAAVCSKVNDCLFCASVHARKAAQMSKRPADVDRLLAAEPPRGRGWTATEPRQLGVLTADQDERWGAIIAFSAAVSAGTWTAAEAPLQALRQILSEAELTDLVSAVAFFSWANRLMLTFGEPFVPEQQ
ncbi:carboxymuconolactone decarboxylase family protein [Bogoriella caseilytica]|uniref:Alkylhydroperoxidase domain protein n=1 Tax=Bogoriella caseilytica TaxID=56055 RepID=A0A3N2B9X4_9MICO|nr:carboxymuconolactone decarboxylase family protein [Bogoriella caseilytica]ROR71894.1 alkylhydroperoxidase domain protein [Bogoriella caseilytica]